MHSHHRYTLGLTICARAGCGLTNCGACSTPDACAAVPISDGSGLGCGWEGTACDTKLFLDVTMVGGGGASGMGSGWGYGADGGGGGWAAGTIEAVPGEQVRKTPSWPRSWANFSPL